MQKQYFEQSAVVWCNAVCGMFVSYHTWTTWAYPVGNKSTFSQRQLMCCVSMYDLMNKSEMLHESQRITFTLNKKTKLQHVLALNTKAKATFHCHDFSSHPHYKQLKRHSHKNRLVHDVEPPCISMGSACVRSLHSLNYGPVKLKWCSSIQSFIGLLHNESIDEQLIK